jgi:hypothetical protein
VRPVPKEGEGVEIPRGFLSRHAGEVGIVQEVFDDGLALDFYGPAPSIEFWSFEELGIDAAGAPELPPPASGLRNY